MEKLRHAAQRAIAGRDLFVENDMLLKQNNERTVRKSVKSTVAGTAKVMSWRDLVEAHDKREAKEADRHSRSRRTSKPPKLTQPANSREKSRSVEADIGSREIEAMGLGDHCSVLQF